MSEEKKKRNEEIAKETWESWIVDLEEQEQLELPLNFQEEAMDLSVYLEKLIGLEQEILIAKKLIDEKSKKLIT